MAFDAKLGAKDLEHVRIPAEAHARLDRFCGSLKLRILEAAVRRAKARGTSEEPGLVSEEDLLQSARVLLPAAVSEFEQVMRRLETSHARNAS